MNQYIYMSHNKSLLIPSKYTAKVTGIRIYWPNYNISPKKMKSNDEMRETTGGLTTRFKNMLVKTVEYSPNFQSENEKCLKPRPYLDVPGS